nr:MAG TPA: tail connector protein [Caudoviricetes sp.]
MQAEQKDAIVKIISLYNLPEEQQEAAIGFVPYAAQLLLTYLGRLDMPRPLYPIVAQLAIAQQVSSGLVAEVSSSSSESGEESTKQQGVKSISQGDTSISFETGGEERQNASSVANSSKIAISPAQVIEENKAILAQFKRGVVLP